MLTETRANCAGSYFRLNATVCGNCSMQGSHQGRTPDGTVYKGQIVVKKIDGDTWTWEFTGKKADGDEFEMGGRLTRKK